jgi:ABC-type transport system substrate-binding protein
MNKHLDVFLSIDKGPPSLNPLDSDGILNAIQVEQIVGTLVRMHPSGRYEGYLAEAWHNSSNFKVWTFAIREGLQCEDGSPINAHTFADSLVRIIKLIKQHSAMPLLDRLEQYNQIESQDKIEGIQALDNDTLQLKFEKPVRTGLLEYLALPYVGFYCKNNFNKDGSWKDSKKLISSASYKLNNWDGKGPLTLSLRKDWFQLAENPPETVTVHTKKVIANDAPKKNGFIVNFMLEKSDIPTNYQVMNLTPTIFSAIIISISNNKWLLNPQHRQLLRNSIKNVQGKTKLELESAVVANRLYPHMGRSEYKSNDVVSKVNDIDTPLIISTIANPTKTGQYMNNILIEALKNLQVPFEIRVRDGDQKNMMKRFRDPKQYDLKAVSVDAGGGIENQLVKFMFCSNLGIAFPDPSERICKLVDEYEKLYGDIIPEEQMQKYVVEFDAIIDEDAAVIPMLKSGYSWLLSKNISTEAISPTMGIPYFDLFNVNE